MFNHTPKKITSLHHPLVKKLVKLREKASFRHEQNEVLVVGKTLVKEVAAKIQPLFIISSDAQFVSDFPVVEVGLEVMKKISGVLSPEPIAALFPFPTYSKKFFGRVVVSDGISDPGNLGTIMRTALAFGWEALYLLPGSVDPFNDKVLRSSRAASFYLPILSGTWEAFIQFKNENHLELLGADLEGEPFEKSLSPKKIGLILGNESNGLSSLAKEFSKKVHIPIEDKMESLNVAVAAGLLLYHFRGQQ